MTRPNSYSRRHGSKRGFTLVEIAIAAMLIGLLAMLALPMVTRARNNARAARFIADMRTAVQAFELQALMSGFYPDSEAAGVIPADMDDLIKPGLWEKPTPIGGDWKWSVDEGLFYAGVVVTGYTVPASLLQAVDARIDDGNLGSGRFQSDGADAFYIIE